MKEPLDKPQPEIMAETRRTYPFPPCVPPTEQEIAIVRALARLAALEYVEGRLKLDD